MKIIELMMAVTAASKPVDAPPGWFTALQSPFLLLGLVMLVVLMFSGKGKRGEEKARTEMLKQLKRGDRVQTIGGIQAAVSRVEEARVELKVDEASNAKIWFARSAIARVLDNEKAETK